MIVSDRKPYLFDLLLLTVVLIWGFNFAVMKLVYQSIHPIAFNAVRFLIASSAMVLLLKLSGVSMQIDREDVRGVVWLGFITNTVYQFLYVLGLDRTKAGNAGLLMALTPIFAYLIGVFMKRERFSPGVLGGIIVSLVGVFAIVFFGSSQISFGETKAGDLMMIGAAFCWGWYSAKSVRWLPKYGALRLTVFSMVIGTAIMLPLSAPWLLRQNWSGIGYMAWLGLGYSALLSIVYCYFIWAFALNSIGVARTAVFSNVTPIVALAGGWALLGEHPLAAQLVGVVLVLTGVFMVRSRQPMVVPDE